MSEENALPTKEGRSSSCKVNLRLGKTRVSDYNLIYKPKELEGGE